MGSKRSESSSGAMGGGRDIAEAEAWLEEKERDGHERRVKSEAERRGRADTTMRAQKMDSQNPPGPPALRRRGISPLVVVIGVTLTGSGIWVAIMKSDTGPPLERSIRPVQERSPQKEWLTEEAVPQSEIDSEIDVVKTAAEAAEQAEASRYAPNAWDKAQQAMNAANAELQVQQAVPAAFRSFTKAKQFLLQARVAFDQAKEAAIAAKHDVPR